MTLVTLEEDKKGNFCFELLLNLGGRDDPSLF